MSNHFAIATVTAALRRLLDHAVAADVLGAHASMVSPDSGAAGLADPGVNIFLYQVSANPAWRNEDLPTRASEGGRVQRSRVGIDLHYLFTFYGADAQFVPQRVLATVIRELHVNPVLTREQIETAVATNPTTLTGSNLAAEVELVKFTQMPISLEELSKLWSVFFQTTYHLSVVYQGSVVLLDSEDSFSSPLPVRARNITVETLREPLVEAVVAASGDSEPILDGTALRIRGRRLSDPNLRVLIDGDAAALGTVTDTEITATPQPLAAGIHGLVIEHPRKLGTAIDHGVVRSDVFPFVLAPHIRMPGPTTPDIQVIGADVQVGVDPAVGKGQRAALLLNELVTTNAHTYTFVAPPAPADTNQPTFTTAGVAPGPYLVRIQVEGADSPLEVDAAGTYSQPQVMM